MKLTDSEYIALIQQVYNDPRSLVWNDEAGDFDDLVLHTGVNVRDAENETGEEWYLTDGAKGF